MKRIKHSLGLVGWALCFVSFALQAQDKPGKGTIKVDLAYRQKNSDLPSIKINAKTKKEKRFEPVDSVEVNLFFNTETSQGFMGRVKTNGHGSGSLTLPVRFKAQWDSSASFKIIGTVTQEARFEDMSTELEISKAKIEVSLDVVDSVRTIHAKVLALEHGEWVAKPETEVKLVVVGAMSDLKATEDETFTTDKNGEVSAEFNLTIPGDALGNVIIGTKIDDHETYGSLVSTKAAKWGVPLEPDKSFAKRTLWSTRDKTPIWLLVFPNLIIFIVWGIIFFLVFQLARIIQLGRTKE